MRDNAECECAVDECSVDSEAGEPAFRIMRNGDRLTATLFAQAPDGEPVFSISSVSISAVRAKVLEKMRSEKMDEIEIAASIGRATRHAGINFLARAAEDRAKRAIQYRDRPSAFVMGEFDLASKLTQMIKPTANANERAVGTGIDAGLGFVLDIVKNIYPGIGGAMQIVNLAQKKEPAAEASIAYTVEAAKQGNPDAQADVQVLKKATAEIERLNRALAAMQTRETVKEGKSIPIEKPAVIASRKLTIYEQGMAG